MRGFEGEEKEGREGTIGVFGRLFYRRSVSLSNFDVEHTNVTSSSLLIFSFSEVRKCLTPS